MIVSIDEEFWREHPQYEPLRKEMADEVINFVNVAPSAQVVRSSFKVSEGVDFIMTGVSAVQMTALTNAAYFLQKIDAQFINDSSGRALNPIPLDPLVMVGGGGVSGPAMEWPWPVIVPSRGVFSTLVTNNAVGAAAVNMFFTFHGLKVFLR